MRRLVALAAVAASLTAVAPAAAADRTDDGNKPVVFLSGGESASVDCRALWKPMQDHLRKLRITGEFKTVTNYDTDSNCDVVLTGGGGQGIEGQARDFATWLKSAYAGKDVDVVAHGSGGVVLRAALALDKTLRVEDAVTLASPHAGAKDFSVDCSGRAACVELDTETPRGKVFLRTLAGEAYANPQGAKGTDWTVMGSAGDTLVSAESAISMDAEHKTTYLDKLTHDGIAMDVKKRNAKLTYSHRGTETFEWRKAPHVAEHTGLDLIMGAGGSQEAGSGNSGDCTGFNDAGGAAIVEEPGLAEWKSTKKQLSYIRSGILEAYSDCFVKAGQSEAGTPMFASSTTVRLNGLDLKPAAGKVIYVDPKQRWVTAEQMSMTLPTRAFGDLGIPLKQNAALSWKLPKEAGPLSASDIDGFGTAGKVTIKGFPLKGLHKLSLGQGYTSLELNIGLPGILSGSADAGKTPECADGEDNDHDGYFDHATISGDPECKTPQDNYESAADGLTITGSLRSDNKLGLQFDKLGGTVEGNFRIGKLGFGGGSVSYSWAEDEWEASLHARVPLPRAPELTVGVGFKDGTIKSLSGQLDQIGMPAFGGLYLQRVKLGFVFQPSWEVTFGIGMSYGPRIYTTDGPMALADVNGDMTFNAEGVKLVGSLAFFNEKWGSGSVEYKSGSGATVLADIGKDKEIASKDGKKKVKVSLKGKFGGTFNSGSVDMKADAGLCFSGQLEFGPIEKEFEQTCLAQGEARLTAATNTLAASACAKADLGVISGSIGYASKVAVTARGGLVPKGAWIANSCDFDSWHTAANASQAGGAPGVSVGAGEDITVIGVSGDGAPPRVALDGPGGASVPAPAKAEGIVRGDGYMIIHMPADDSTYVLLGRPAAGRWTVQPQAGSAPVTEVRSADALPQPSVKTKVRRVGRKLYVDYDVAPLDGQVVRLREVGSNVSAPIGVARGARGTLRLKPAFGRGGTRKIVAEVEQNGYPRTSLTVGRYVAPALKTLGAPKRLVARGARVSWSRVAGAQSYVVGVRTSDGRNVSYEERGRQVTIKRLAGHRVSEVVVRAVRADGALGRAKTLR